MGQCVRLLNRFASNCTAMETDHEIDLIVEGEDRKVVALEVKLSESVGDQDVRHLNWLHNHIGDRLAYRRPDGVAVVPLALLGP